MAGIYAIGSNGSGQLGIGHKEDVSVPKEVLFPDSSFDPSTNPGPVTIKAGGNHTLLLTSSGTLLSSGDSSQGARGLDSSPPSQSTHFSPVIFTSPSSTSSSAATEAATPPTITHCAATWESSIVVAADTSGRARNIYTFGTGNKGELGLGSLIFRSARPQLVPDFPPKDREVVDLAACVGHVVVVLDNGDVYGWGNGRKGQLGEPAGVVHDPRRVDGVTFPVTRAVCGREFTYLLGAKGGSESLFLGAEKWDVKPPADADIRGWTDVGAGWGNIVVLKDDGKVLSWGRNDHGQCAPADLPVVDKIAVGSEHTLALTREGDVLAWGWGEHGNCGPTKEGDVRVATNVVASARYLPEGSSIASIGGGCATSWVCVVGG
ncbi:hypothetical protein V496_05944 [Pseudogymnoascus sp. VKM F-4515 (FW-2607)]|nr:hypothetical protein V496_05944 [Pseudogymnoascus sp. VKM F-4515 (FW-2607)]